MTVSVADDPMASRYEARIDGKLAGVSEYEVTPDTIVFPHTVVADQHKAMGRRGNREICP
jgi:hypothetical protein